MSTFGPTLPPPTESTLVYLLNPPGAIADRVMFAPLASGLRFPMTPEERRQYLLCEDLDEPQVPVPRVPARVPDVQPQRIEARRWNQERWQWDIVPVPEWARPQSPDTPDLAVWDGPRHWERQGWEPNPHLVPAPRASADGWWATLSPYSLLFGPPLELGRVPLAYVEVTLAVQSPEPVNYAEWLFLTPDRGTFGGDSVFRFAIEADGAPHTYAVPLYHLPRTILEGPVTQLALRPVGTARALVRIDRIRLVPWKAPAAAP